MFKRFSKDRCYVIAEIGGNFTTIEQAKRLVDDAAKCGVDAVKLQTYRADTVASRHAMFDMENTGVVSQHELFKQYEISGEIHAWVFQYASALGLDWFSTPAHESDVDLLESLQVGVHKIGSDDAVNLPFLSYVAKTQKPIILSTGMCTLDEVRESVDTIVAAGNKRIMLLHAITNYPTHIENVNLRAMQTLQREFPNLDVGYSDHTVGTMACICAAAMGARIIEKHFTYDKQAEGPDHILSADPREMRQIVTAIREFEILRGDGVKRPSLSESSSIINNRKSIVLAEPLHAGERIVQSHLSIKRPGYGVPPKFFAQLIGRTVRKDMNSDDVLCWDDLV